MEMGRHFSMAVKQTDTDKDLKDNVTEFQAHTDRICEQRIRAKYNAINILKVHAYTEGNDLKANDEFYEEVSNIAKI